MADCTTHANGCPTTCAGRGPHLGRLCRCGHLDEDHSVDEDDGEGCDYCECDALYLPDPVETP